MASSPIAAMASTIKIRTAFFGIWKTVYLELKEGRLNLRKSITSEIEKAIEITQNAEVKQLDGSNKSKFSVHSQGEQLLFMASSPEDASQWVNALRSAAFPVDTLSPERFSIISVIGRGYFGKVMLVRDLVTGEMCAVKTIHKSRLINAKKVDTVITERNILLEAKHPFIVGLKFAFQTVSKFYIGMEFAAGGELFRLMTTKTTLPIDDIRIYLAEIALALEYLHSIGVVYRDLKPENILLSATGHIKLTDFGLSKDISGGDTTTTFVGTMEYVAREVALRQPYSYQVDWWSLGVLAYEMMIGRTPFYDTSKAKIIENIMNCSVAFPDGEDQDLENLILGLLNKDPAQRFGINEIKSHPFFRSINFDDVLAMKCVPSYVPGNTKATDNFDSEFTAELPLDSQTNPPDGENHNFSGFSFPGFPEVEAPDSHLAEGIIPPDAFEKVSY